MSTQSKASRSSRASNRQNTNSPEFTAALSQFMAVTNMSIKDATKYIIKYGRAELAIDAYYNDPEGMMSAASVSGAAVAAAQSRRDPVAQSQLHKLNALFDKYKAATTTMAGGGGHGGGGGGGEQGDTISIDGTIKLCADLEVDPEDVVLLAVACELKAPGVGEFTRAGWKDGWRGLGVDSVGGMKNVLPRLRRSLGCDFRYFRKVYLFTFDFARTDGQRSLGTDTAQAFWELLIPHAVKGGALAHVEEETSGDEEDVEMEADAEPEAGWSEKHTQWWFEFLSEKAGKGISRDTWNMFISFVRTIDAKFESHNLEGAWPSLIDDFVEWARKHRLTAE